MKKSTATKNAKTKWIIFETLSVLVAVVPLLVFIVFAFCTGETQDKLVVSLTGIIGLAITALNVMLKWHLRCALWIVLFGVTYCFREQSDMVLALVGTMGGITALDEFVLSPLAKKFKNQFQINKEIDKRL